MSTEAVRRQILISIGILNIPLDRTPTEEKVIEVCSAAKMIRNRLLREHTRVTEKVESLREKQVFDEESDSDEYQGGGNSDVSAVARCEYVLLSEMMVAEKVIIPLLLAHGMKFSGTLLPQLLKLLAALFLPVPRFSANEMHQRDLQLRAKRRCGTDEFFALLVQVVAPLAEKRANETIQRDDVVLLEVVLSVLTHLLEGMPREIENIVGSFCRNHGLELLLVVVNQNYSKTVNSSNDEQFVQNNSSSKEVVSAEENLDLSDEPTGPLVNAAEHSSSALEADEIKLSDGDSNCSDTDYLEVEGARSSALDHQFVRRVHDLLESDEQIWKWNTLVSACISSIFKCIFPSELANLFVLGQSEFVSPEQLLSNLRDSRKFQECKRETDNWRFIAKSRNGAINSNSVLVRVESNSRGPPSNRVIGTVSAFYGNRRKDPIETLKDVDRMKRGRFIKGMFQDNTPRCDLPLPTKVQLSQQCQAFLCYGFEPLSSMMWQKLQRTVQTVERAAKEYKEMISGYQGSGEAIEITSPLDAGMYKALSSVLDYMQICTGLLRYIREVASLLKDNSTSPRATVFQQQWQSACSVISLEHFECGFSILRSFLQCKDLRRRENTLCVTNFLAEMLLVLNLLLEGQTVRDPTVEVAAHALASSVLYKEENIKALFDLLNEYAGRTVSYVRSQGFTLFVFAIFQLMDKCSYKGSLLLPKRPKRQHQVVDTTAEGDDDANSVQAIDANEDAEALRAMINDDGSDEDPEAGSEQGKDEDAGSVIAVSVTREPYHEAPSGTQSERAYSEAHPQSVLSLPISCGTIVSTIGSEREVAVGSYCRRLATPKNIGLLYSTLRHWRINDAEVNLALTYLMERLISDGCGSVFFNVGFLLLFRDVIVHGSKTHAPLFAVCDQLVHDFFNPEFTKGMDAHARRVLDDAEMGMLSGSQSFLGFEVALRCGRSLFNMSATDYAILEEKAMPHAMEHTAINLPPGLEGASDPPDTPVRKKRRKTNISEDHGIPSPGASRAGGSTELLELL